MTSGDRATDLASIWMLFGDAAARQEVIARCTLSEYTLQRAKGWAIGLAIVLLDTGLIDHPQHAEIGEKTLKNILTDMD